MLTAILHPINGPARKVSSIDYNDDDWAQLQTENRNLRKQSLHSSVSNNADDVNNPTGIDDSNTVEASCYALLTSPFTGSPVHPATSKLGLKFFRCYSGEESNEPGMTEPETIHHIMVKTEVCKTARALGLWSDVEVTRGQALKNRDDVTDDDRSWIADVLIRRQNGSLLAVEVQWSKQTESRFIERQNRYHDDGVNCIWLYRMPVGMANEYNCRRNEIIDTLLEILSDKHDTVENTDDDTVVDEQSILNMQLAPLMTGSLVPIIPLVDVPFEDAENGDKDDETVSNPAENEIDTYSYRVIDDVNHRHTLILSGLQDSNHSWVMSPSEFISDVLQGKISALRRTIVVQNHVVKRHTEETKGCINWKYGKDMDVIKSVCAEEPHAHSWENFGKVYVYQVECDVCGQPNNLWLYPDAPNDVSIPEILRNAKKNATVRTKQHNTRAFNRHEGWITEHDDGFGLFASTYSMWVNNFRCRGCNTELSFKVEYSDYTNHLAERVRTSQHSIDLRFICDETSKRIVDALYEKENE